MRSAVFFIILGMALIVLSNGFAASDTPSVKKWLVVENKPTGEIPSDFGDFPRLLLMKISKAGVFRCVDRATYRTQAVELALGASGDADFTSAGYCISWIVRIRETVRGQIVTASIGYNNIGKGGNNELVSSEDVVVFERSLKGVDLTTMVAEKAAVAILFKLMPPQVVEVGDLNNGKRKVIVDYGEGFLNEGDDVYFVRKKKSSRGREFSSKVGEGVVASVTMDSATVVVRTGMTKEGDYITFKEKEDKELMMANLCPMCDGRKKVVKEEKCSGCNGHGFTRIIKQRSGRWRDKRCNSCFGKGIRKKVVQCPECNGMGK